MKYLKKHKGYIYFTLIFIIAYISIKMMSIHYSYTYIIMPVSMFALGALFALTIGAFIDEKHNE